MDTSYLSLEGKVALVTGGSRGIGRAIALTFADAGADVVISSRKLPALEEVAAEIRALGRRALPVAAHNREPEQLHALIEAVKAEFGRLDILVNNAATNPVMAPLVDIEERTFDVIMNTNLKGYFILSQLAAKMMIAQGEGGNILNISSVGGVTPDKGLGVYCISKAAINMLTRALAIELGEYNIRVNALAPGVVKTRFSQALWSNEKLMAREMAHTPLQRIAEPEEVARMALAMVSDAAAYITGQIVVMDGGGSI
ncbi:MAG: glucose 1-dehydrogenase [Caldilineae bacterium]|nr:MAG: glucose 1-dehydrogenase [Caldilineae bacterium]